MLVVTRKGKFAMKATIKQRHAHLHSGAQTASRHLALYSAASTRAYQAAASGGWSCSTSASRGSSARPWATRRHRRTHTHTLSVPLFFPLRCAIRSANYALKGNLLNNLHARVGVLALSLTNSLSPLSYISLSPRARSLSLAG